MKIIFPPRPIQTNKLAEDILVGMVFTFGGGGSPVVKTSGGYLELATNTYYTKHQYVGIDKADTYLFTDYKEYPNAQLVLEP